MATTVGAYLNHDFIGKSKQDRPYTARAHSRYIQRESATQSVHTYLMPEDYNARQRWFFDHENGLRKNGRVIDKFIIAIPRGITEEHAAEALLRFGKELGQERAPFMFSLQGFDTQNHHAHFIYIDRDVQTGERVYGTTERNSSRGIKLEWERVANTAFAELGYDIRIQVRDGVQAENDNHIPEAGNMIGEATPDHLPADDPLPETEDAVEGDSNVPKVAMDNVDGISTIQFLHDQRTQLEYLRRCQQAVTDAKERYEWLALEREKTALEAGEFHQESLPKLLEAYEAEQRFTGHQRENGKLKGVAIGVLGFTLFKTAARKEAEQSQVIARNARLEADRVEYTRNSYERKITQLSTQATQEERKAYTYQAELTRLYGEDKEIEAAETAMENGIKEAVFLVTLGQAVTAYGEGIITEDEYRTFLVEGGYEAELQLLDEGEAHDGPAL